MESIATENVKPFKRFPSSSQPTTGLKPGANESRRRYFAGDAVVVAADAAGDAAGEAAAGVSVAAGDGTGVGVASMSPDCKTERVPVTPGSDRVSAMSMNAAAAPIVILASTLAVPRGPNAALETPPEKRSPALDLPGCNNTATTRTIHDSINKLYKM